MVCHDVVGTVTQEQIVHYIQHISPVHSTNEGGGGGGGGHVLPLTKLLRHLPPWLYRYVLQHTVSYNA